MPAIPHRRRGTGKKALWQGAECTQMVYIFASRKTARVDFGHRGGNDG
jgi:hypothetical protein